MVFDLTVIEEAQGFISFEVSGKGAKKLFQHESGGHRWQRIPPTEKRGRVQTSTVTVAVLEPAKQTTSEISESDIEWTTCRGSGAGGQHRNRTESAVQMTHKPSGLRVRIENERSQAQNRELALRVLSARLAALQQQEAATSRDASRKAQVGSGMRGDKIRTIRQQDGIVTDHQSGNKISYKNYSRGEWDGLF